MIAPPRTRHALPSPRVVWLRPTKLAWLPVVAAMLGFVAVNGPPHMLWEYRFTGSGDARTYLSCRYVGRYGRQIDPVGGTCPGFIFLNAERSS